jgi:hypothetical protein
VLGGDQSGAEIADYRQAVRAGDHSRTPGAVRASAGSTRPQPTSTGFWPPSLLSPPASRPPSPTGRTSLPATTGRTARSPDGPPPIEPWGRHAPAAKRRARSAAAVAKVASLLAAPSRRRALRGLSRPGSSLRLRDEHRDALTNNRQPRICSHRKFVTRPKCRDWVATGRYLGGSKRRRKSWTKPSVTVGAWPCSTHSRIRGC